MVLLYKGKKIYKTGQKRGLLSCFCLFTQYNKNRKNGNKKMHKSAKTV